MSLGGEKRAAGMTDLTLLEGTGATRGPPRRARSVIDGSPLQAHEGPVRASSAHLGTRKGGWRITRALMSP